ncbi:MAG: protein translocase subunit SecF [Candidatus Eremiobacteraeota bacterium]|nr:protein translocase subunit SecF [Candidatus Eremiobacteraeota bacterium]
MFFRRLNWNVVGWFGIVSAISYAVIFAGLVTMGVHTYQRGAPLRLGLSFTGGTDVTVKFNGSVQQSQLAAGLEKIGVTDARINTLAKPGDVPDSRWTVETQTDFGNDTAKLWNALSSVSPVDRAQSAISSVGPSLSHEYLIKAAEALVVAISIQFVYIAFRFGWNYIFGLVTIVALVRDALMMIGIYAMFDKRVDDAFLAAVLTVIGYSVMDTIVILDRIRENTKLMEDEPYEKIVNTSILQTMTRSFNTLATVVITLVALLAFGGASLQNFAFALLVGICSGGYHSIFYSAPLVVRLRKNQLARAAKRRAAGLAVATTKPRTVAEARAQANRAAIDRDAVLAARRERKEKEKESAARAQRQGRTGRYRKKRADEPADARGIVTETVAAVDEEEPYEVHTESELIDPLDAQRAGLDEEAMELGHEEIRLNLDEPDETGHGPQH